MTKTTARLGAKHLRRSVAMFYARRKSNFTQKLWKNVGDPIAEVILIMLMVGLAASLVGLIILTLTILRYPFLHFSSDFTWEYFGGSVMTSSMIGSVGGLVGLCLFMAGEWVVKEWRHCWRETSSRGLAKRYML